MSEQPIREYALNSKRFGGLEKYGSFQQNKMTKKVQLKKSR